MVASETRSELLQRLVTGASCRAHEVESIVGHLRLLLNTRQGTSTSSPTYGLLDLLPLLKTLPQSRHQLCEELRQTIMTHEPRLVRVVVHQVVAADPMVLHFEITASLRATGDSIVLKTRVLASQRLEVMA